MEETLTDRKPALASPKMFELECPDPKGLNPLAKGSAHHMVWYEHGDPAGRPVLCVHGLLRNGHDFDFLARRLAEKGYRVIAPDVVGRGRSAWLKNSKSYGYALYCADMLYLLKHLGISKVDWVGTSMGGLMGMMVAASKPELINRLVLNDIGSFIPRESLMRIGGYIAQRIWFSTLEDGEEFLRNTMGSFGIRTEAHWKHIALFNFIRAPGGGYHIAYDPALANAFKDKSGKPKKLPDMDFAKLWDTVKCPTLILRGAESDLLLKETALKMAMRNNTELVEFPATGHAPMLMEEGQIQTIVNWLEQAG